MEITCEKDVLLEGVQTVTRGVAGRVTLPVLGGVRIAASRDGVELAGTDLEMFVVCEIDAAVERQGALVAPGRLLGEIVKSLPAGRVRVKSEGSQVIVEGGRSEFMLTSLPENEFPKAPEVPDAKRCVATASELGRALRQVVRAAGTDEARPVLTGVLWALEGERLKLVATDSYRLAIREVSVKEYPGDQAAIVPGRALGEFARHLATGDGEASVRVGDAQAGLATSKVRLTTRLIEGEFPNYRQLLPQGYSNRLTAGARELLEVVGRVGLLAQANTPLKLHLADEVQVTASESGVGEASEVLENAEYQGEPMVVAFNPRFLSDGLEGVEEGRAVVEMGDPAKPVIIRAEDDLDFTYLLMPVRLPG